MKITATFLHRPQGTGTVVYLEQLYAIIWLVLFYNISGGYYGWDSRLFTLINCQEFGWIKALPEADLSTPFKARRFLYFWLFCALYEEHEDGHQCWTGSMLKDLSGYDRQFLRWLSGKRICRVFCLREPADNDYTPSQPYYNKGERPGLFLSERGLSKLFIKSSAGSSSQ